MRSLKYATVLLAAIGMVLAVSSQANTILIDFGNDSSWRGVSVPAPDVNGNYWNSLQPGLFYPDLIDSGNGATTIDFGFSTGVATDSYNGPAGDTAAHPATIGATDIDAGALGDLGIINAAYDYAAGAGAGPVRFEIQQLDPTKQYNLTFYGSHKFNADASTVYSVYTDNTYSVPVGSVALDVFQPGSPWLHNRDTVVSINSLSPQASDILYVEFVGSAGGDGFLNSMRIEVIPEPTTLGMVLAGGLLVAFRRIRKR